MRSLLPEVMTPCFTDLLCKVLADCPAEQAVGFGLVFGFVSRSPNDSILTLSPVCFPSPGRQQLSYLYLCTWCLTSCGEYLVRLD